MPIPNKDVMSAVRENAEAAAMEGYVPENQPGASDITPAEITAEQRQSAADVIRERQSAAADDREAMFADIASKRRQHQAASVDVDAEDDLGEYGDDVEILDNPAEVLENQVQEQEPGAASAAQPQEVAASQEEKPGFFTDENGAQFARIVVDGTMKVVPAEQALRALQKLSAGDERLRQAAQAAEQVRLDQAELQRLQAAQQQHQPSSDAANVDRSAKAKDLLNRLYNEGDESAMEELAEMLGGTPQATPQVDTSAIAHQTLNLQNQINWNAAVQADEAVLRADEAYADVTGNTMVYGLVVQEAGRLTKEYGAWQAGIRPIDIMAEAADNVRTALWGSSPAAAVPVVPAQQIDVRAQSVAQRKATLGNTVAGGGAPRTVSQAGAQAKPDGGQKPDSMNAKRAGFEALQAMRTTPAIKR